MEDNFHYDQLNGMAKALGGRIDLLEKLHKRKKADLSYEQIRLIVQSGFARDFYDIGDEISSAYLATDQQIYDFPWTVVDFRDVFFENDPMPHPGMILQSKYATMERLQYDQQEISMLDDDETKAQEGWYYFGLNEAGSQIQITDLKLNPGDDIPLSEYEAVGKCGIDNPDVFLNGYNRYAHSAVRQWLNSTEEAGAWWKPMHFGDVEPNELGDYNGFARGFETGFLDIIQPVRIKSVKNSLVDGGDTEFLYDRFFLPSSEELYGVNHFKSSEGPYFEYWKETTGFQNPSDTYNQKRTFYLLGRGTATKVLCILRSIKADSADYVAFAATDGQISSTYAYLDSRYTVCCAIC